MSTAVSPQSVPFTDHRVATKQTTPSEWPSSAANAHAVEQQKAPPAQADQRKKRLNAEEDLLAQEGSGQVMANMADEHAGAQALPLQDAVLYAQASTGSEVVTDAGAGSTSTGTAVTPASTAITTPAITTPALGGSGMLVFGGVAAVGMAAAARNGGSPTPPPAADSTPPTLAITMVGTPQHGQTVVFTFSFNEDVTGFNANSVELSGGTRGSFVAVNARTYTLAVTVGSSGQPVTVGVAPGAASDLAGNAHVEGQVYETSTIAPPVEPPASDTEPPSFTAGASATANAAENATTTVHTAAATDNVAVTAYAFASGGADNDKFNLNTATGALTFKVAPNFEMPGSAAGTNAYTVKVQATDAAGNSTVQTVTINVGNVNEAPTVRADFVPEDAMIAFAHGVALPADASAAVDFTDPDANDSLSYSLVSGAVPGVQLLANGQVQGTATQVGSYNMVVRATDAGGLYVDNAYQVDVVDVTAPVFAEGVSKTVSVAENTVAGTVIYSPGSSDNVAVTGYALAGGADDGKFNLNPTTGALSFKVAPDFETPGSAVSGNAYSVAIMARYAANNSAVGGVQRLQGMAGNSPDSEPQTAALNDGGYVITWHGGTSDGQGRDIFVQRYAANNSAVGGVQRLQGMAGSLWDGYPQTIALGDGGYVMTWHGETSDGQNSDIFVQLYAADNSAVGGVQRLQGMAGNLWDESHQTVALVGGGYVVSWSGGTSDGQATDVFFQRFNASGTPAGGVQRLQGELEGVRDDVHPRIKALPDGGFVMVWTNGYDQGVDAVFVVRYDAQGQVVQNPGAPLVVDTVDPAFANGSHQAVSVFETDPNNIGTYYTGVYNAQATANGGADEAPDLGVVYRLSGADAALFNINSKTGRIAFKTAPDTTAPQDSGANNVYDLTVTAIDKGGNTATQSLAVTVQPVPRADTRLQGVAGNFTDRDPQTTALKDGGYVITWHGETSDGQGYDIFVQRYAANNSAVGGVQRLQGMVGSLWDYTPQTTTLSDGGYVITWHGETSDGQRNDIFVQRYAANNSAVGGVQRLQGMAGNLADESPQTTALSDGGYAITWHGETSDGKGRDIFVQRYAANNSAVGGVQRLQGMAGNGWDQYPQTTALSDGGYVITWQGISNDGQSYDIFVQRYAANNSAVGGVQRLQGTPGYGSDSDPQVAALADGGYVLVWRDFDICVQRFAADNTLVGGVQRMTGSAGVHDDEAPQVTALNDGGFTVTWQGETPDGQDTDIFVQRFDAQGQPVAEPLTTAQTFTLWQEAADAHDGDTSKDINALNQHSAQIVSQRDTTSRDGSANQADPAKRLTEYVDQVTGTDIVSAAEFNAGFTLTGQAAAGQAGTIQFWLDKDRTNGVNEVGMQLQHGQDGVSIDYNNATGEYSISFAAGSTALQQATHNTWGSGVHQITVDTDGNGAKNGSEASRLFLVASGTAQTTDTGLVSQNYSVQDRVSGDLFVYYYGDPDGTGVGVWTGLDKGDSMVDQSVVTTDQDGDALGLEDFDYYASNLPSGTGSTAANTAMHFVTDIKAQVWEFHMARYPDHVATNATNWSPANEAAVNHDLWDSNTSRLPSLAEVAALYAANFGGDSAGGNTPEARTVGAIQAMSDAGSTNVYVANEHNQPAMDWDNSLWSAGVSPTGHLLVDLYHGNVVDMSASQTYLPYIVAAVL